MAKEPLLLTQEQEEYLSWLLTPELQRTPSTKKEWAAQHDLHHNTMANWEKKKNFIERWRMGIEGLNQSPERTQRLLDALYDKGLDGDVRSAELYLKATGNMPNQTVNIKNETTVKEMSDEDLERMILELGAKHKTSLKVVGE